jgi:hypothetical protein
VKERRQSWIARHKGLFFLLVPLFLSSFTHLYNPAGFPWIHEDEGHYLRRAMSVLQGFGPQETSSDFDHPYDHPYFGQLLVASILNLIGYPHTPGSSLSLDDGKSIEMLYLVPRLLMGLLAISDTFLVYKIAERRYGIRVALIASVLFAVMPLSWLLRGVFLDNILLPFMLVSILFALYAKDPVFEKPYDINMNRYPQHLSRRLILVLLSGIFLGIAIYTKIPACAIIPLVAFIIYKYNKNWRILAIWFTPVVLIAALWPVYNILSGQLDDWVAGVVWQVTERPEKTLSGAFIGIMRIDPVLITLGVAGLVFTALLEVRKREYFMTLWITPYLIFLYLIGWVSYFHWVILIPGIAVSSAIMINAVLSKTIDNGSKKRSRLISRSTAAVVAAIGIFGLLSSAMLIGVDATSSYFELYSFIVRQLIENEQGSFDEKPDTIIVGHRWTWAFTWIPKYIFNDTVSFLHFNSSGITGTERFLLIVDNHVKRHLSDDNSEGIKMVQTLYNNSHAIKTFKDKTIIPYDKDTYPYTSMSENRGIGRYSPVEIRTNTK